MKSFAFAVALLLAGCATSQTAVLSPRELNEHAAQYDRAKVQVRGMLVLGTNGRSIYQSHDRFEQWEREVRGPGGVDREAYADDCLMLFDVDRLLEHAHLLHGSTLTISGTFVADFYEPDSFDMARCSSRPTAFFVDDESVRLVLRLAGVGDPGLNRQASAK
jgi:hypothetical protein